MSFREPNEVRWVGVRPAHRGEQVVKSVQAENSIALIYTVPSGKTLYLKSVTFCTWGSSTGLVYMGVRNASDADQYYFYYCTVCSTTDTLLQSLSFDVPLEIPSNWDIFCVSNTTGRAVRGFIFGWEE
jgi:hypothetical protein